MFYDAKAVYPLLILMLFFVYTAVNFNETGVSAYHTSQTLGKIINRLVFDKNQPFREVVFVGDVLLARDVERRLGAVGQQYPFSQIKDFFEGKFVVGNFEAVIPKIHQPTPDLNTRFSVKTDNLDSIVEAKFTHWSLANNHSNDFGSDGFHETVNQLELRRFSVFGISQGLSTTSFTQTIVNNKKIGLIAFNAVSNDPEIEGLLNMIKSADSEVDYLVVYPHWGDEYQVSHNLRQELLAHLMIDSGVDLIVGSHPHVVQDVELYKNRLIFYSLGNLLFDQYFSEEVQIGLMISLLPQNDKLIISLVPVSSFDNKIQPKILEGDGLKEFLIDLSKRSSAELKNSILSGKIEVII